ncbi:hypothetical protein MRX96_027277 [Rhipicephalus microplus]
MTSAAKREKMRRIVRQKISTRVTETNSGKTWTETKVAARANYNVVVTQDTLSKMMDIIPVLVYVAGYCVYSTLRRLKCEKCRDVLTINKEVTVSVEDPKYELVKELD